MKKYLSGILLLGVVPGLFSCMGDSNEKATYQRFGVAMLQPQHSLYTSDGLGGEHVIVSPALDTVPDFTEGSCFRVEFRADIIHEVNATLDVEVKTIEPINLLSLETSTEALPDTVATTKEQFFTPEIRKAQFLRERLFLQLELKERRDFQTEKFIFQYNPDSVKHEEGRSVYDIYLRALREEASDSGAIRWIQTEALLLEPLLKVAQKEGLDSLHFRLNYPNMYSQDSTQIRWTQAAIYSIGL